MVVVWNVGKNCWTTGHVPYVSTHLQTAFFFCTFPEADNEECCDCAECWMWTLREKAIDVHPKRMREITRKPNQDIWPQGISSANKQFHIINACFGSFWDSEGTLFLPLQTSLVSCVRMSIYWTKNLCSAAKKPNFHETRYENRQVVNRGGAFMLAMLAWLTLWKTKTKVLLSWLIGTPYTGTQQNLSDKMHR
jgi:hypothetical protein